MPSIERTRELLPDATQSLSDAEVAEIRDITRMLAKLTFDNWMIQRKQKKAEEAKERHKPESNKKAP